jgi:hypothetical protein
MSSFNKAEIMPRLKQGKGTRRKTKGKGQKVKGKGQTGVYSKPDQLEILFPNEKPHDVFLHSPCVLSFHLCPLPFTIQKQATYSLFS